MIGGSKLAFYHMLRGQGLRLYASRRKILVCSSCGTNLQRTIKTEAVDAQEVGFVDRVKERFGFQGSLRAYPVTLRLAGSNLYLSASEAPRYNKIIKYVKLPDTLSTWHKLTALHIWLLMTRLVSEGREGKLVRNQCVQTFIVDMKANSKLIARETGIIIQGSHLEELHGQFLASLLLYDEGFLGSDKQLASALWRSLYNKGEDTDPQDLEILVEYIRKQTKHLESVSTERILTNGLIPFLPVEGENITESVYEWLTNAYHKQKVVM